MREAIGIAVAESLRAVAVGQAAPTSLEGAGSLRLTVEEREAPALNLRFTLRDTLALRAGFRPGMLAPVLSMASDRTGWQLLLPKERAAVVGRAATDTSRAAREADLIVKLSWYLLQPQALLASLPIEGAYRQGPDWILDGVLSSADSPGSSAEVWIDRRTLGIHRWRIVSESEALAVVTYQPPRAPGSLGDGPASRIVFEIKPLNARGSLRFQHITPATIPPKAPPAIPGSWSVWEDYRVTEALTLLLKPQANH